MTTASKSTSKAENKPDNGADDDSQAVLSIETLAPKRPYVVMDGERHYLRMRQDFGAIEHQEFSRQTEEYDQLWSLPKLNRDQRKRYESLLDRLFDRVLVDAKALREQLAGDNPDTGEPRLTGAIKREVVLAFTNAPLLMAAMAQQAETKTKGKTEPEDSSTMES